MQKQKHNKQAKINEIVGGYNKRKKAIYSFNNENYRNGRSNISNVDIQNIGETECVVEFKIPKKDDGPMAIIKTAIICLILFFGVGFSIMSFNNDVSIDDMFSKISKQFTGDKEQGRKILEYCYSIGLGVGIIIFYNHFGPKKLTKDPTPIEVEMRKYERDINQTLIDGHNRDDGKVDVK